MLTQELKKLKLQSELISVSRDCSDEDLTGTIEFVSDDAVVMCLYTDDGEYDGFTLFETHQIDCLFWGNREHEAIKLLVNEYGEHKKLKLHQQSFESLLFELAETHSQLCFFHQQEEDSFDIGEIKAKDKEWIKIHTYGPKNSLSRLYKLIRIDTITRVTVDSPYQNKLLELFNEQL